MDTNGHGNTRNITICNESECMYGKHSVCMANNAPVHIDTIVLTSHYTIVYVRTHRERDEESNTTNHVNLPYTHLYTYIPCSAC